jgi:hypothetical protein
MRKRLVQPVLYIALCRDKQPWWWSGSCMSEPFPLAFVIYFGKKVGGVRLMCWMWVISYSNHWHLQWQDLSASNCALL